MRRTVVSLIASAAMLSCTSGPQDSSVEGGGRWEGPLVRLPPEFVLGNPAPDFTLAVLRRADGGEVSGDSVRLSEARGSVVVLDFWNTGCGPCVAEHEMLVRVAAEYMGSGVEFYGITEDSNESLARFVAERGEFSYTNLRESEGIKAEYRVNGWPTKVVIDRDGNVAWWRPGGPMPEATLVNVIDAVLDGRRPDAPTSAAYP